MSETDYQKFFLTEWRDCLEQHYIYVLQEADYITEATLREILIESGIEKSYIQDLVDYVDHQSGVYYADEIIAALEEHPPEDVPPTEITPRFASGDLYDPFGDRDADPLGDKDALTTEAALPAQEGIFAEEQYLAEGLPDIDFAADVEPIADIDPGAEVESVAVNGRPVDEPAAPPPDAVTPEQLEFLLLDNEQPVSFQDTPQESALPNADFPQQDQNTEDAPQDADPTEDADDNNSNPTQQLLF